MGSESESFVQAEAAVKEVDLCQSSHLFSLHSPSIEPGSSHFTRKDTMVSVKQSEIVLVDIPCGKLCKDSSELSVSQGAEASEHHDRKGKNGLLSSSSTEAQQRKAGKVSKSSSLYSRKQHMVQLKDPMISARMDDVKGISDRLGSHPKTSNPPEKAQLVKPKINFNSKRAERKLLKVSGKSKCDYSFSMKASSGSFYSATSAASNFFGGYGLKSDVHDITEHAEDLPLKDLLGGTCECPSLSKDIVKKEAHANDSFLLSVRKACSIIQLPRLVQSLNIQTDGVSINKTSSSLLSSVAGDKGDNCVREFSSRDKDFCSKTDTPANSLDIVLYKPDNICELLALPPPKDLDSLLQDATKPSTSSKNAPDMRSGKQLSRRASLQPFQWSHTFSGHCKPISDSAKLSLSKNSCPGRWSRIRNFAMSQGNTSGSLINLESLTYDQSLVPLKLRRAVSSVDKISVDLSDNNPQYSSKLLSSSTSLKAPLLLLGKKFTKTTTFDSLNSYYRRPQSCFTLRNSFDENGGHCPMLVAAAQTLVDMSVHSSSQQVNEMVRWPKKPSQKAMKARNLKSNEKPQEVLTTSNSGSGADYPIRNSGSLLFSKMPIIYQDEKRKDVGQSDYRKGPLNWSNSRSSRSSPSKLSKDSIKQSRMMPPPPATTLDKSCEKLMPMEWRRGKDRIE